MQMALHKNDQSNACAENVHHHHIVFSDFKRGRGGGYTSLRLLRPPRESSGVPTLAEDTAGLARGGLGHHTKPPGLPDNFEGINIRKGNKGGGGSPSAPQLHTKYRQRLAASSNRDRPTHTGGLRGNLRGLLLWWGLKRFGLSHPILVRPLLAQREGE